MYENKVEREKVILVAVSTQDEDLTMRLLDELEELADTAGADTVGRIIQNREAVHSGTYVGKGKVDEIKAMIESTGADGIICDDELSPAQMKNLEELLSCKIMDRTMLILDIFAQHASTREGKLQIELAQLKYSSSRLVGMRSALSRLGGGIGTRGPGEKKLEMDRRVIRDRITQLQSELEDVRKNRDIGRAQRSETATPVIAIVGYTNAGKSTLLNRLTASGVLEEDKLFATLDPTTRNMKLESGEEILLTDTVGFIRKLPHHLIEAFRSTLEEAKYADLILHVVDASNPEAKAHMDTVYETLARLDVGDKPVVTLFNKADRLVKPPEGEEEIRVTIPGTLRASQVGNVVYLTRELNDEKARTCVKGSAKTGEGLDVLLEALAKVLAERKRVIKVLIPYSEGALVSEVHKFGTIISEEYRNNGTYIEASLPAEIAGRIEKKLGLWRHSF